MLDITLRELGWIIRSRLRQWRYRLWPAKDTGPGEVRIVNLSDQQEQLWHAIYRRFPSWEGPERMPVYGEWQSWDTPSELRLYDTPRDAESEDDND